ncbi:NAC domain-containing protein 68-like [Tripterygium wilfordii]|uniref:NAC domain-containing protein 68-like n=2 Tax=Tripterygium wilfordii TaxID=458696 RepID=A0A7J7DGC3_TRIWF|nr:NAC domain-containing protein 68-like [Tripterygium wilfordii]
MASHSNASDSNSNSNPPPLPNMPPHVAFTLFDAAGEEHELILPSGYHFVPKDDDLILFYLHNKIIDQKDYLTVMTEMDLYNHDPDQIPNDEFKYGQMNDEAYYFTEIDEEYLTKSSQSRATNNGVWKKIEEDEDIVHNDEVIGFKKILAFYWRGNVEPTDWSMHEYRVNPASSQFELLDENAREKMKRYVLCKIKKVTDEPN